MLAALRVVGVLVLAGAVAAGVSYVMTPRSTGQPVTRGPVQVGQAEGPQPAAQRAAPSVVRVEPGGPTPAPSGAGGSGVIVDARGFVITAESVVAGASGISVAIPGGKTLQARVVGTDPLDAIAVLKVDATDLHAITTTGSNPLETGGGVVVMAAPPAFQVAVGVVASAHVSAALSPGDPSRVRTLNDLLALDVAPRDGQLGAPLLDGAGRLIGLVVRTDGGVLAADYANAQGAVKSVIETGHATYPTLGFDYRQLTVTEASERGVSGGVLVLAVAAGGAAEAAGIHAGDVVVSASGTTLDPGHPLLRLLRGVAVRQAVDLLVRPQGGGAERTIPVAVSLAPA